MRAKKISAFLLAFVTAATCIPAIQAKAVGSYQTLPMDTIVQGPLVEEEITDQTETYYKFTMKDSGRVNVTITRPGDVGFTYRDVLYEADGEVPGESLDIALPEGGTNVYAWDLLKGDYFLVITDGYNYTVTLTPEYSDSTFEESIDEQNYNELTAKKVAFKKTIKAAFSMNESDGDFYKVKVGSKGILSVTVNTKVKDAQLVVYKMGQTPQSFDLMSGKSANKIKLDSKGTYYVALRTEEGTGNYNFKLNFKKK